MNEKQQHWNKIYSEKSPSQVSWYEPIPEVSLEFLRACNLPKDAAIIDIGGGDSFLAEFLVSSGYTDVTVLDISEKAIKRAKERMCEKADLIEWIVADVTTFKAPKQYDFWHDRAVFHFLTEESQQKYYVENLQKALKPGGFAIIGTFSENGPEKCSGLPVQRYSVAELQALFQENFNLLSGMNVDHLTPANMVQNFTFCSFQKK